MGGPNHVNILELFPCSGGFAEGFRRASWWFLRAFSHIEARLWVDARLAAMTLLRCGPDEVEVARAPSSIDSKALCARSRSFRT